MAESSFVIRSEIAATRGFAPHRATGKEEVMHSKADHQSGRTVRIALYSHDTMGLGHVRRNLLLAQALADSSLQANTLIIAGVREAGAFAMPQGGDCLTLPAYRKDHNGEYAPRSLAMETTSLAILRSQVIGAALKNFAPDLFIVDNVPRGALQELTPVLDTLERPGKNPLRTRSAGYSRRPRPGSKAVAATGQ
ncbi:MAG: hypothetical protein U5O69_07880 [Candidatus Competibacteraceae bacterium]|nr:hypothetical protein [Candidatus Competibacteraceae bacterium]